ncbi:uncharacterized protein LOC111615862 isoform X2 [Centruroides sculpturatus]|uniref:uncharacterized protein LOC111615862 isoform X2 n=1 Tax=Centruroides sculpturatus TaxID=218467 RepID=UPI000C6D4947|nr:uncharacterized protein LOC111615862 isoform X2 [Centruroides sculpturatus]
MHESSLVTSDVFLFWLQKKCRQKFYLTLLITHDCLRPRRHRGEDCVVISAVRQNECKHLEFSSTQAVLIKGENLVNDFTRKKKNRRKILTKRKRRLLRFTTRQSKTFLLTK